MKHVFSILVAACLAIMHCLAQFNSNQLIQESIGLRTGTVDFRDIPIDWTMDGKVQAELNEGLNQLKEGKYSVAVGNLTKALKIDTNVFEAYYYRAIAYKIMRRYDDAEEDLRRLRAWKKEEYLVALESGKVAQLRGDVKHAKQFYSYCIRLKKDEPAAYNLLSNLHIQTNNLEHAKTLMVSITRRKPRDPEPYIRLGLLELAGAKNQKAGDQWFERAWKADSTDKKSILIMAISKVRMGSTVAIPYWDRLVALDPQNISYRAGRSFVYTLAGNYDGAFADLRLIMGALDTDPNQFRGVQGIVDHLLDFQYALYYMTSTMYGLSSDELEKVKKAYCLISIGDFQGASNQLMTCTKNGLTRFLLGITYEHGGRHDEALQFYNDALRFDPDIFDAHKKRGIYRMEFYNWIGAEEDFNDMLRLNPESVVAYQYRGIAEYKQGKFESAIKDFTKALEYDSTNVDILEYRGLCYERSDNYFYAICDYLKANAEERIDYDQFEISYSKAVVKDTARVLRSLISVSGFLPEYFPIHYRKLELLVLGGHWEAVKTHLDRALRTKPPHKYDAQVSWLLTLKGKTMEGQPDKAKTFYKRAMSKDSKNALALLYMGQLCQQLGEKEEAIQYLQKAARLGQSDAKKALAEGLATP